MLVSEQLSVYIPPFRPDHDNRTAGLISERFVACVSVMKVNLLAIIGGLLGVMCLLLPWTVTNVDSVFGDSSSEMNLADYMHEDNASFSFAVVLFLLCSALVLVSPLGAVGQFFAWLIFLATVLEDLGTTETSIATITTSLGLGFVAGAVAWGLVLVSLIKPIGPGHAGTPRSAIERFLTWCP